MVFLSKKILIVDDSLMIVSRLKRLVQKSAPAETIFSAGSYKQAIEKLATFKIDIALFDIHLGNKSGIDLLKFTKSRYPDICIIMFTNQSGELVEASCMNLGASYFLDKSTDFPKIPQLIASLP